ncbi:MAG: cobalamin biosynthesis protein CobQ [Eubacterium sp.]|jgi:hypothetical protein|nr:cobalamin biosynthesis protein CobQ [Eubacterium sp.]
MEFKKIVIVTGHYGSGKTNLSANIALYLAAAGKKCAVADLDIVNPYFRAADFKELFFKNGISLLSSRYANSTLDVPSLTIGLDGATYDNVIIDVGGDDSGAFALGRFELLKKFGTFDVEMLYVINRCRYLIKAPGEALCLMREIEAASGLKCTGIVNNTNLGSETNAQIIKDSLRYAAEVAKLSCLKVKFIAVRRDLCGDIGEKGIFPIDILIKQY